jgi:hypothetical protein
MPGEVIGTIKAQPFGGDELLTPEGAEPGCGTIDP